MRLWGDSGAFRSAPFAAAPQGLVHLESVERLKDLTRARFGLSANEAIMVSETACEVPGGPAVQTVIAFWTEDGTRHKFRAFKPVTEMTDEDVPPAWLKASLAGDDMAGCACC